MISLPMLSTGQERFLLGGILKNHLTGKPVMAAHVMNLTDSLATISSPDGAFKIPAHLGDSLVFTSIGYANKGIIVSQNDLALEYIEVKMVQRDYELSEVEVNPIRDKGAVQKEIHGFRGR